MAHLTADLFVGDYYAQPPGESPVTMRDHTHDSRTGHGYINLSVGTEFTVFTDDADWLRSLAFVANSAADALDGVVSDPESTKPLRGTIGQPIPAGALGEGIETDAVVDHCSPW